jgi:hypothetical protein
MTTKTKKAQKTDFDFRSIKSYEDACKHLNIDPANLPDVSNIPEEFRKSIISHYKLMIIYKAINNGWVPDWNDWDQYKYFPWFRVLSSGFGFDYSYYDFVISRLRLSARAFAPIRVKRLCT